MLYSVFDPSGVDLRDLRPEEPTFREALRELSRKWATILGPISRIRNNFAFHGARSIKGAADAENALRELGESGLRAAFELIQEVFQFVPDLGAEAGLSYRLPQAMRPEVERLRRNCNEIDSLCVTASKDLAGEGGAAAIASAKQLCEKTRLDVLRLAAELEEALPAGERQFAPHFLAQWDRTLGEKVGSLAGIEQSAATVRALGKPAAPPSPEHVRAQLEGTIRTLKQLLAMGTPGGLFAEAPPGEQGSEAK